MSTSNTSPDEETQAAERSEAGRSHTPDREPNSDEEERADQVAAGLSSDDRERISEHEREMDERGAHQKGEGKID
jgi:hypothetical protein